ncbi:hypothetical protein LCGC14_2538690 [marine sediment metagenome]|uniref:Uncharacterized protein n=1 Tax=marine sediment metagenome TaxID=412755 RepID=A0A0F9ARS4_9ZZZZ
MTHYIFRNAKDEIHVQNAVRGYLGQHHIHDSKSYFEWVREIPDDQIREMHTPCDCGREHGTYTAWPVKEGDGDE